MNEAPDPLEALLSALRPHEVSPGLRRRVAERLADSPPQKRRRPMANRPRRRPGRRLPGGGPFPVGRRPGRRTGANRRPAPARATRHFEVDDSGSTLLAYRARPGPLTRRPGCLARKDAVVAPEPNPELARIGAFTRSDAALHALLGED